MKEKNKKEAVKPVKPVIPKIIKEEKEKPAKRSVEQLNDLLIDNFVNLQKTMTNLAEKFDLLSGNIAKLLTLFEMTARSFANNPEIMDAEKDKEFLDKLNALVEQNKTIAKGLTLMEEKLKERIYGKDDLPSERPPQMPQVLPSITDMSLNQMSTTPGQPIKKLPRF
jgi:hypothetical protein